MADVAGLLSPATDVVNRGLASVLGGGVDATAALMSLLGYQNDRPVGGSEWIGDQMQRMGMVTPTRRPLAEDIAGALLPFGATIKAAKAPVKVWQTGQKAVSENVRKIGDAPTEFADFTYIFPDRQKEVLEKRLKEVNAPRPEKYAVEVSRANDVFHPNTSRIQKGDLPPGLLGDMYEMVYQGKNQVGLKDSKGDRFLMVNLEDKFPDERRAAGLFSIRDGKIYPETAFPVDPDRAERMVKKKR